MAAPANDPDLEARLADRMVASQRGDSAAYTKLLSEIAQKARRFIARRISDVDAQEDFVQDVLLCVHKARPTYDPGRLFLPWFWAIARRRYVDHLRRFIRTRERSVENFPVDSLHAPQIVDHGERADLLERALQRLPKDQKNAVELTKLQGLSVKTAAQRLNMTENALRVSVHRARKTLFHILKELGYEDN